MIREAECFRGGAVLVAGHPSQKHYNSTHSHGIWSQEKPLQRLLAKRADKLESQHLSSAKVGDIE